MSDQDLAMLGISDDRAQPGMLDSDQEGGGSRSRSHLGLGDRADSIELGEDEDNYGLSYYQNDLADDTDEALEDLSDGIDSNNLEPSGEKGLERIVSIPNSRRSSNDGFESDNYDDEKRPRCSTVPQLDSSIYLDKPQRSHNRQDSFGSWAGSDSLGGSNTDFMSQLDEAEKKEDILSKIIDELREWIEHKGRPAVQELGELKNEIGKRDMRVGELEQKLRYQQMLVQDLQHEREDLQEQLKDANEHIMSRQSDGIHGEISPQTQNYLNELDRERTRYEDLKVAFTEQSANMGRMAAMLTERNQENQTLNQDKQVLTHDYQNVQQENHRLHQRIGALQKKHEVTVQELKARIHHQNEEISHLTDQLEEMMQKVFQLNENQEMLIMKNEELALASANDGAIQDQGFYISEEMGDSSRSIPYRQPRGHQRQNESFFNEMNLEAEMGEVSQNRSGSLEEKPRRSRHEHVSSMRKRNKSKSKKELVRTFLNDLKDINSSSVQHELSSDLSKIVTKQVQTDIQRTLKTFVREDLVATVRSIFSQSEKQSSDKQSTKTDAGNVSLKNAAREVFREETGALSKTLELFSTLCSSLDLTMLKSLSDTNTKLVESLCASRESVEVLQNQMQTVIVSHMEEVTSTINELGITDGAEDKANLEKVIRESTMEALSKMKPTSSMDQEKAESPAVSEKALPQIEKEYLDKIEKLEEENKNLTTTLTRAGRDKLMAMSRLNSEMNKLRSHIRSLQADYDLLKAKTKRRAARGRTSREWKDGPRSRSPTNSVTFWSWGNV